MGRAGGGEAARAYLYVLSVYKKHKELTVLTVLTVRFTALYIRKLKLF